MPSYQIEFVGGGLLNRPLSVVVCNDDHQALHWAADRLAHHLGGRGFQQREEDRLRGFPA